MVGDPLDDWIDKALAADPLDLDGEEIDEPKGPPPTAEELSTARRELAIWQSPDAFKTVVDGLVARCRGGAWFNDPHLKFLHDAFVLARFARLQCVDQVRLADASAQWPDGFVQDSQRIHNVEVTSTHGGRKLGDEYREQSPPEMDPVEAWVARAEAIPQHLDAVVRAKAQKRYSEPFWLVVYLNINEMGVRQRQTEQVIAETKQRYAASFDAISVLWKAQLY